MNAATTMFLIMAVFSYCISISGFVEPLRRLLKIEGEKWDKPLFCPRCYTFWIGLVAYLISGNVGYFLWGIVFSWLADFFPLVISIIEDFIIYLHNTLTDKLNK